MIVSNDINVSASFDSGTFTGCFGIYKNSNSYNNLGTSIQTEYQLTSKDFQAIEMLIAIHVGNYLKNKETK